MYNVRSDSTFNKFNFNDWITLNKSRMIQQVDKNTRFIALLAAKMSQLEYTVILAKLY